MARVGIVTPCHNGGRFLAATLASLRAQTHADWEQVIVDDGSTDDSLAIAEGLAREEPRVRVQQKSRGGSSSARNAGLRALSPKVEFVLFLDADDLLEPGALASLSNHLEQNAAVGIAYGRYRRCDVEGRPLDIPYIARRFRPGLGRVVPIPESEPETPFATLFAGYEAIPSVTMYRRALLSTKVGWDETLRQGMEDKDFFLACALGTRVHFLPATVAVYRRTPGSLSSAHGIYTGLRQVRRKWAARTDLSSEQRTRVRFALALDSWLSSVFASREAMTALRSWQARRALTCALQCVARGMQAGVWGLRSAMRAAD